MKNIVKSGYFRVKISTFLLITLATILFCLPSDVSAMDDCHVVCSVTNQVYPPGKVDTNQMQHFHKFDDMKVMRYPYPNDHFIEIVAQIGAIKSLIKCGVRDQSEIEFLEKTLLGYKQLLDTCIKKVIDEIENATGSFLYIATEDKRISYKSYDEWKKRTATYFPKNELDLITFLKREGYTLRIQQAFAKLRKKEQELEEQNLFKKKQEEQDQKEQDYKREEQDNRFVGRIKAVNESLMSPRLISGLTSQTITILSLDDIKIMQNIIKLAECVQRFDDSSKTELVSSKHLLTFLQECAIPDNCMAIFSSLGRFQGTSVPCPVNFLCACKALAEEAEKVTLAKEAAKAAAKKAAEIKMLPIEIKRLQEEQKKRDSKKNEVYAPLIDDNFGPSSQPAGDVASQDTVPISVKPQPPKLPQKGVRLAKGMKFIESFILSFYIWLQQLFAV